MTWASIFPLGTLIPSQFECRGSLLILSLKDVIKTRVQTWDLVPSHRIASPGQSLLNNEPSTGIRNAVADRPRTLKIARDAYQVEGVGVFFRGLGICSARAFVVNAVQWAVSMSFPLFTNPSTADTNKGIRMDDESASCLNLLPRVLLNRKHAIQVSNQQLVKHVSVNSLSQ